jgi:hypothetical protein
MSPHSDTLSRFRASPSWLLLLNTVIIRKTANTILGIIKDTTDTAKSASYIDLYLEIDNESW